MKIANLIKSMKQSGIKVERIETKCAWGTQVQYVAETKSSVGEWYDQGSGEVMSVYVRPAHLQDDSQSDCFYGSFAHSIKQAVSWMLH